MEELGDGVNRSNSSSSSSSGSSLGPSMTVTWRLSAGTAFSGYVAPQPTVNVSGGSLRSSSLRFLEKRSVVSSLTKDIVDTYTRCNPDFRYSEALNPKRYLTNPSATVLNNGHDNANSDLVLYVNLELVNLPQNRRYIVKEMLGQGTFGQVAKCWEPETNTYVAVKVIKNQPAYTQQAMVEVSILDTLNRKYDPEDKNHIVRILDYFMHHQHLCIAFEMLGNNLYELIKGNRYKGLPLSFVQRFSKQILQALVVMKDAGIIHCDLKPENILLCPRAKPAEIKVIDFGSACEEGRTVYSYIQSRYYRSPEVLLGYPYTTAIDMWSFGCIVAELFLGLPLFPGSSEYDLLKRMMEILGGQPPDNLLRDAKNTTKFFKQVGRIYSNSVSSAYRVLTEEEYETRESKKPQIGKRYFKFITLEDIISQYPYRNMPEEEISRESSMRKALIDFLRGLVEFDPVKRWSPLQAIYHPFVTGEEFKEPYKPLPETPRIPVFQAVMVDHNPGGGHWVAAGLSPQVGSRNRHTPYNSPHFPRLPPSYGSSYGSVGSHGSYNDSNGLGTSYGSYGDHNTSNSSYYSPLGPGGFNLHGQVGGIFLGSSPDVRRRPQLPHNNPNGGLGLSPSNLGPMSLGASPSQFTPPNSHSHMQIMPGASPGRYGPTSPVRGGAHGSSSLGKQAVVGQYNRRRWPHLPASMPHYDHGHGHYGDGPSTSHHHYHDGSSRGVGYSHSMLSSNHFSNWRQQQQQQVGGGRSMTGASISTSREVSVPNSFGQDVISGYSEVPCDTFESTSIPNPADWDPNYSEEMLLTPLQEDNSDVSSLPFSFNNSLHLGSRTETATTSGHARFGPVHAQPPTSSNYISLNQRIHRSSEASSSVSEGFCDPSAYGGSSSSSSGYYNQIYNNRQYRQSGQQPSQRGFNLQFSNVTSSSYTHGSESGHQNGHAPLAWPPRYTIDQTQPSNSSLLGNGIWGQRGGHSLGTAIPPRNEYGQQIL
ncbi:hypothetical protein LUZ63_002568 [Rhynchospora breviuscula]|uniref:Protein kinase domain-containing protein n=1 Tax=Rhynchospora breviuscula TaxID=2022672 RepID=A0A9Q0CZ05_9POAL|nr:hypothetical protein LUZ63_002568 [Rhynchospora breviuscula]